MNILDEPKDESQFVQFKSIKSRSVWALIIIGVTMCLMLVVLFLKTQLRSQFVAVFSGDMSAYFTMMKTAELHDKLEIITLLIYIVSFIAFFVWLYPAHNNLERNKLQGLSLSSGQAVGFFFIPFANLYYSVVSLREVYGGTLHVYNNEPRNKFIDRSVTILPVFWIICQSLSGVLSRFGLASITERNVSVSKINSAFTTDLTAECLHMAAGVIIFVLVIKITRMQECIIQSNS